MRTVFVYGTLKQGFPNYEAHLAHAKFLGPARTVDAYPLVSGGQWHSPYLIDEPGQGHLIHGELFGVDEATLAKLDILESIGKPNGYVRAEIMVDHLVEKQRVSALVYFKPRNTIDVIHRVFENDYLLDAGYVPVDQRG